MNHVTGDDFSLRLTPDGRSLYFASNRPGGFGKADMYVATRASPREPFHRLENLGPLLNTPAFKAFPTPSADQQHRRGVLAFDLTEWPHAVLRVGT